MSIQINRLVAWTAGVALVCLGGMVFAQFARAPETGSESSTSTSAAVPSLASRESGDEGSSSPAPRQSETPHRSAEEPEDAAQQQATTGSSSAKRVDGLAVEITQPAGSVLAFPTSVPPKVVADVQVTAGTLTRVDFLSNGVVFGSDSVAPFEATLPTSPPLTAGSYSLVARAVGSLGTTDSTPVVVQLENQTPFSNPPPTIPGRIEPAHFDLGGSGVAYFDSTPGNQGGALRTSDDVDIVGSTSSGFRIANITAGEWLEYTVHVPTAGAYTPRVSATFLDRSGTIGVSIISPSAVSPVSIPVYADIYSGRVLRASDEPLVFPAAGKHVVRVEFQNSGAQIYALEFVPANNRPIVSILSPSSGSTITPPPGMLGNVAIQFTVSDPEANAGFGWLVDENDVPIESGAPWFLPPTYVWRGVTAGPKQFRILQSDTVGSIGRSNLIAVSVAGIGPCNVPGGSPQPCDGVVPPTGRIEAENFAAGPRGSAYEDSTNGNSGSGDAGGPGQYRVTDVDIFACAECTGYAVGSIDGHAAGPYLANGQLQQGKDWLNYVVSAEFSGVYGVSVNARRTAAAGASSYRAVAFEVDGVRVTDAIPINSTSWSSTPEVQTVIDVQKGTHAIRLVPLGTGFEIDSFDFVYLGERPVISMTPTGSMVRTAPATISFQYCFNPPDAPYCTVPPSAEVLFVDAGTVIASVSTGGTLTPVSTWQWSNVGVGSYSIRARTHYQSAVGSGNGNPYGESEALSLEVFKATVAQTHFGAVPMQLPGTPTTPGTIQAEAFDVGGQNVSYFDQDAAPRGNNTTLRPDESVDIDNCPAGQTVVRSFTAGEWMEYTVDMAGLGGYYQLDLVGHAAASTGAVRIQVDGQDYIPSLEIPVGPAGNCPSQTTTSTQPTVPFLGGRRVVRITALSGDLAIDKIAFRNIAPAAGRMIDPVAPNFASSGSPIEPRIYGVGETIRLVLAPAVAGTPLDSNRDVTAVEFYRVQRPGDAGDMLVGRADATSVGQDQFTVTLSDAARPRTGEPTRYYAVVVDAGGARSTRPPPPAQGSDEVPVGLFNTSLLRQPCAGPMLPPAGFISLFPQIRCNGDVYQVPGTSTYSDIWLGGGSYRYTIVQAERFDGSAGSYPSTPPVLVVADGHGHTFFSNHWQTDTSDQWRSRYFPTRCVDPNNYESIRAFDPNSAAGTDPTTFDNSTCFAKSLNNGEWLSYSLQVTESGPYQFRVRYQDLTPSVRGRETGESSGEALWMELARADSGGEQVVVSQPGSVRATDGAAVSGLGGPDCTQVNGWTCAAIAGPAGTGLYEVTLPAGRYIMRLRVGDEWDVDWIRMVYVASAAVQATATIIQPQSGARFARGGSVTVVAEVAGGAVGGGQTSVAFYCRSSSGIAPCPGQTDATGLFGTDSTDPYSATLPLPTDGSYRLTARVTAPSAGPESTPVPITVEQAAAPSIALQLQTTAVVDELVNLSAVVNDPGGPVSRVRFIVRRSGSVIASPEVAVAPWVATWRPAQSGSYRVTAQSQRGGVWSVEQPVPPASIEVSDTSVNTVSEVPDAPATPAPSTAGVQAGAVAGEFKVDESGAATYSMPIYVPPGAGGVVPQLALHYSSSAADGYLGHGFTLAGMSAISRCRKTVEHGDGVGPHPTVDFSATDQFCADGQRLLIVGGSHGLQGAEYRTEIDSFQKVVIENRPPGVNDPQVFVIYGKDGTKRRYGEAGSQVTALVSSNARVLSWMLSSIEDPVGNRINFTYSATGQSGELVIDSVTYRGGRVAFDYTPQDGVSPPLIASYAAGAQVTRSRLITRINVDAEKDASSFQRVRSYVLNYGYVPGGGTRVRINEIRECAPLRNADDTLTTGESCYAPTTFAWADMRLVGTDQPTDTLMEVVASGNQRKFFADMTALKYGDIDGDGRADVIWNKETGTDTLRLAYSQPTSAGLDLELYTFNSGVVSTRGSGYSNDRAWHLFDFNADGREDLLEAAPLLPGTPSNGSWGVRLSQATPSSRQDQAFTSIPIAPTFDGSPIPFTETRTDGLLADFNADGLTDLVTITRVGSVDHFSLRLLRRNPNFDPASSTPRNRLAVLFGPPITLTLPKSKGSCELVSLDRFNRENSEAFDVDGDGSADLKLRGEQAGCSGQLLRLISPTIDLDELPVDSPDRLIPTPPGTFFDKPLMVRSGNEPQALPPPLARVWLLLRNPGLSSGTTSAELAVYGAFLAQGSGAVASAEPASFRATDINGDGLADVVYKRYNADTWFFRLNTGTGFGSETCVDQQGATCQSLDGKVGDSIQFLDYDGDGRLDFWRRGSNADCRANGAIAEGCYYRVLLWNGMRFQPSNQYIQTRYLAEAGEWQRYFADMDGDGLLDGINIQPRTGGGDVSGAWETRRHARTSGAARQVPLRNLLVSINNGMGASTIIDYAPLTFSSVYQRDFNAATMSLGRGSAVFDVAGPSYVVSAVASSAPAANDGNSPTDFNAMSYIYYRYAGMKMQGGGRGSLGFRKVYSTDAQTRIETETTYGQAFPLTGVPLESRAISRPAVRPIYFQCDSNSDSSQCHRPTPVCATGQSVCDTDPVAGTTLSLTTDTWRWRERNASAAGVTLGAQVPLFVYGTSEQVAA